MAMKNLFIALLCTLCSLSNALAQSLVSQEYAHNEVILRLEVHQENAESDRLKLILKPIESGTYTLTEQTGFVIGWNETTFNTKAKALLRAVWPEKLLDTADVSEYKTIDTLFNQAYKQLRAKYDLKLLEMLNERDYGLSDYEIIKYNSYKPKLEELQDSVGLYRSAIRNVRWRKIDSLGLTTLEGNAYHQLMGMKKKELKKRAKSLIVEERLMRNTMRNIDHHRQFHMYLIGDANVVSSFQNATGNQLNAGFGILAKKTGYSEFIGIITLAQGAEDSTTNYGQSILIPGVRRFSLMTSFRSQSMFRYSRWHYARRLGIQLDINITPYRWIKDSLSVKVVPFAANVMFPYTWVYKIKDDKEFAISTDLGLAFRAIGGDVRTADLPVYIGTEQRFFFGPVGGITIKYHSLRAQFHAPLFNWLPNPNRTQIQGLTNGQVYATIGIIASISEDFGKVLRK